MDLKTTIRVESEAKLDAIRNAAQELQNAADMSIAVSKAQQLLGKEVANTNKAIQAHIKELQNTADNLDRASDEYKNLQDEIGRYTSELKNASNAQDAVADSLQDLTVETKSLPGNLDLINGGLESMKGFLDEIVIGVGIAGFTALIDSAKQLAGQITDTARATGVASSDLAKLATFAKMNGVEFETLQDVIITFSQNLGEVAKGEGEDMVQALSRIGVKATDSSGKLRDTMSIFLDVSKAFNTYADGAAKSALAAELFDDEGTKMIGVLSRLHNGFAGLSGAVGQNFIKILDESEESSNLLALKLFQVGTSIGEKLLPILTILTNGLNLVLDAFLRLPKPVQDAVIYAASLAIGLGALSLAFTAVSAIVPIVVTAIGGLLTTLSGLGSGILALANPITLFTAALTGITKAAGVLLVGLKALAVGLTGLLGPIGLVVAGIIGVSTILYASNKDFRNWFNNVARILGDNLYTFLVGATTMFKRFAVEVGNALNRVGQGIANFFSTQVFPVLGNVVAGLVRMFDAFFKWIFHGFDAVAKKVIELYQALPEQIRALLGQVGNFIGDVFENLPVFKRTRELINLVNEAMRVGRGVRQSWGFDADRQAMVEINRPRPVPQIQIPAQEAKTEATGATGATRSVTPTDRTTKPSQAQTDATKRSQEITKIRDEILKLQQNILDKLKESYQTTLYEIENLRNTIKQTLAPFDQFNKSTNLFLKLVKNADFKFPTKAQEFEQKYTALFARFNTAAAEIRNETEKRIGSLAPKEQENWKKIEELYLRLGKLNSPPATPRSKQGFEDIDAASVKTQNQLLKVEELKNVLELIKTIMPELQKDIENMLNPQQEQLKTAMANLDVTEKTSKFLAQGIAPEQARINALAEIEKEQRKESLAAIEVLLSKAKQMAKEATGLGLKQEELQVLQNTVNTLSRYQANWDVINQKIDEHNRKITEAEKRNKQLTDRRERNLQIAESVANSIGDGLSDVFDLLLSKTDDWGAALRDIASNVLKQIAAQLFQIMVIMPIVKSLAAGLGGMFGIRFADGGIMTSSGPVELKKYARGGIANSPQLALFGEGRMPEAYVPLPDGRRIPVAMEGNTNSSTSNYTVNVSVDATGSQVSGNPGQGEQFGRAIAQAIQSEIIKQQRPGGLLYT